MKLTEKDKAFLETLNRLMDSNDLWVELRVDHPSYMVLRGTYGDKVHRSFRMTRQGVRWRFWRLFNHIYVSAFETILFIERIFGSRLRVHAICISKERHALRQALNHGTAGFQGANELRSQEKSLSKGSANSNPTSDNSPKARR